jgi:hypothetical protein
MPAVLCKRVLDSVEVAVVDQALGHHGDRLRDVAQLLLALADAGGDGLQAVLALAHGAGARAHGGQYRRCSTVGRDGGGAAGCSCGHRRDGWCLCECGRCWPSQADPGSSQGNGSRTGQRSAFGGDARGGHEQSAVKGKAIRGERALRRPSKHQRGGAAVRPGTTPEPTLQEDRKPGRQSCGQPLVAAGAVPASPHRRRDAGLGRSASVVSTHKAPTGRLRGGPNRARRNRPPVQWPRWVVRSRGAV